MNFARYKCDARAMQSIMQNGGFALHAGNESRCAGIAAGRARGAVHHGVPNRSRLDSNLKRQCWKATQAEHAKLRWPRCRAICPGGGAGFGPRPVDVSSSEEGLGVGRKPSTRAPAASVLLKSDLKFI